MATYQADTVWTPVIPSFKGFGTALDKGTTSAAAQSGKKAGSSFAQSFNASGIEAMERRLKAAVTSASKAVVTARSAEEDATRKANIEELKLQELREKGKSSAAQLATAEDRLIRAQKQVAAAQSKTAAAGHNLADAEAKATKELKQADTAAEQTGKSYVKLGTRIRESLSKGSFKGVASTAAREGEDAGKRFGSGFSSNAKKLVGGAALFVGLSEGKEFIDQSISAASDLNETISKSTQIFGSNEAAIEKWADSSATSLGLSKGAALDATAALGDMFSQIGFTGDAAAKASKQTVQMAADLGSFSNLETGDVLERINGAFRGEYDSLQKVIPNISAARVETEAMALSGVKNAGALTAQQKAQAVLSIVQKDGRRAMGDFARTSDGLANSQKILGAELEDVRATVGTKLVPILATGTHYVTQFLGEMKSGEGAGGQFADAAGRVADIGQKLGGIFIHDVLPPLQSLSSLLGGTLLSSTDSATVAVGGLLSIMAARKVSGYTTAITDSIAQTRKMGGEVGLLRGKVGSLAGGLGSAASVLGGPWGIAIGFGLTALTSFATQQKQARVETKNFTDSLTFQKGELDKNSQSMLANQLAKEGSLAAALQAGVNEKDYTSALIQGGDARQQMADQLHRIASEHSNARQSGRAYVGNTDEVSLAAIKAARALDEMGSSLDLSQTQQEQAGRATASNAKHIETLAEVEERLKLKHQDLITKTQTLIDKFTILKSGALGVEQANNAWQASLDDVSESVKQNGRSLSSHSDAGRTNRGVIATQIQALNDKITADFKATEKTKGLSAATKDATGKLKSGKEAIVAAATAAGLNKREINKMITQMLKTPDEVKTEVKTSGVPAAKAAYQEVKEKQAELKDKTVTTNLKFTTNGASIANGLGVSIHVSKSGRGTGGGLADGGPIPVPRRAFGGVIPGFGGPREDNIMGIDRQTKLQTAWVSAKEFVVNAMAYAKNKRAVEYINAGGTINMPALADGGQVLQKFNLSTLTQRPPQEFAELGPALAVASTAIARSGASAIGKAFRSHIKDALASGESGGPVATGGYARALSFAKSQAGKPYVWAAAGPGGYDCSGFMGAIQNVIYGKSPYARRWSTMAFQGQQHAQGYTKNKVSPFRIGVTNAGVGHTAGTLNGHNVESRGGAGVIVGSRARGWNNGLFPMHYGLAGGGQVPPGNPPFDRLDPRGRSYDPTLRELMQAMYGTYDSGGMLQPGLNVAYNGTGKPERVLTDQQWAQLGGNRGGPSKTYNFGDLNGPTARELAAQFDEIIRQREALESFV